MSIKLEQNANLSAEMRLEADVNESNSLSQVIVDLHQVTYLDLKGHLVSCLNDSEHSLSEQEVDCLSELVVENPLEVKKGNASKLALKLFYRCNPELFRISDDLVSSADFVDAAIDSVGLVREVEVIRAFFAGAVAQEVQMHLDAKGGLMTMKRNRKLLEVLAENSAQIKACIGAIKKMLNENNKFRILLASMQKLQALALGDNSEVTQSINNSIMAVANSMCTVSLHPNNPDKLEKYIGSLFNQIIDWIKTIILASYGIVENKSGTPRYSFIDSVFNVNVDLRSRINRFNAVFYTKDVPRIKRLLPILKQELYFEFFDKPKTVDEAVSFLTSLLTDPDLVYFLSNRISTTYYTDPNFNKLLDPENVEIG